MEGADSLSSIRTVGYGSRSIDELLDILAHHQIAYVIDVRSSPWSRYKPEFNQPALADSLAGASIRYVFMGNELGGRPKDNSLYSDEGHADYERMARDPVFLSGLERLITIDRKEIPAALLCSEEAPERCHRSKLIGEELAKIGIEVGHIAVDGEIVSQSAVMLRVTGSQLAFDELAPPLRSHGKYFEGRDKVAPGEHHRESSFCCRRHFETALGLIPIRLNNCPDLRLCENWFHRTQPFRSPARVLASYTLIGPTGASPISGPFIRRLFRL